MNIQCLVLMAVVLSILSYVLPMHHAIATSITPKCRRQVLQQALGLTPAILFQSTENPQSAAMAIVPGGLASKLSEKDPNALKNSLFNIPPTAQIYPQWMKGKWNVVSSFRGYIFPSVRIPKETLTQDFDIPGFQKCSIAATCDVGRERESWELSINSRDACEDRQATLRSQIDGYLGYSAVNEVVYDPRANPNRISIDFVDYKTINAERIELFCNARESEEYTRDNDGARIFVCAEYIRQVTFGGGSQVGIPRQVVGNYAHFWTWKFVSDTSLIGNLLTACYLDPQDNLFFEEPSKPVAIYSHSLSATKVSGLL